MIQPSSGQGPTSGASPSASLSATEIVGLYVRRLIEDSKASCELDMCRGRTSPPLDRRLGVRLMPRSVQGPVSLTVVIAPEEAYLCTLKPLKGNDLALDKALRASTFSNGDLYRIDLGLTPPPDKAAAPAAAPIKAPDPRPELPEASAGMPPALPAKDLEQPPLPVKPPQPLAANTQKPAPQEQRKEPAKKARPVSPRKRSGPKAKAEAPPKQARRPEINFSEAKRKLRLAKAEIELIDAVEGRIAVIDGKVKEQIAALQAQADREIAALRLEQEQAATCLKELMKT